MKTPRFSNTAADTASKSAEAATATATDSDSAAAKPPGNRAGVGQRPSATLMITLSLLLIAALLVALCVGRYPLNPHEVWLGLTQTACANCTLLHAIVMNARAPRLIAAALVGAALSTSGAAYQAVFRNPLVSPGLLGVLSGAALGAALGLVANFHAAWVQLFAFLGGVVAVAVGVGIARLFAASSILMLVLGGLVSNALFTALLSLVKFTADPENQLPAIVYWLLGSLAQAAWPDLLHLGVPLALGTLLLCLLGPALDALSLSDDEARSLGVPVSVLRYGVIALATLLAALTVSLAGMIGWVGLLIPHIARMLAGASNRRVLPVAACLGALFLVCADTVARTVSTGEIPLGIVTELFGALAFVLVLNRLRRGWL